MHVCQIDRECIQKFGGATFMMHDLENLKEVFFPYYLATIYQLHKLYRTFVYDELKGMMEI